MTVHLTPDQRFYMQQLHSYIGEVRGKPLHHAQIQFAQGLFVEGRKVIQSQWGRSCGKTEAVLFCAWTYAQLFPGSEIYIVTPETKQGEKIYWISNRLQTYGPREWIAEVYESKLLIRFKNGSYILLTGSDNYDALRGTKPHLCIYDEFQSHCKEFDIEVMRPNLLAKSSTLLVAGTPPKRDGYYYEFKKALLSEIASGDDSRLYLQFPTSMNPIISEDELAKIKRQLIAAGDEAIWRREYLAEDCIGGRDMVYPLWDKSRYFRAKDFLLSYLSKDRNNLQWHTVCDPGTSTVFGVLFACYNPVTSQLFILDEFYEKDPKRMDSMTIWKAILAKQKELMPGANWITTYDEAAAWFGREILNNFKKALRKTKKSKSRKDSNISLIKMIMAEDNALFVSNTCKHFDWECSNYISDEHGDIPDENDHLMDCLSYLVMACRFKFLGAAPKLAVGTQGTFKAESSFFTGETKKFRSLDVRDDWTDSVFNDSLSWEYN